MTDARVRATPASWLRSAELAVLVGFGFLAEWLVPAPWTWLPRIGIVVWFVEILRRIRRG